MFGKVLMVFWS